MELTDTTWVNWGCPPPKDSKYGSPAVACCDGHYYIAFEYFRMIVKSDYMNISLMEGILAQVIEKPTIRLLADSHGALSIAAYRRGNGYIVHELSHLAEKLDGAAPEIAGGKLLVNLPHASKATLRYPQVKPLPIGPGGIVELPPLKIHQIIELE